MFAPGVALNQQKIGTTIRPSSTALLTIDSEDRFKNYDERDAVLPGGYNYSPYDFTITKNQAIMNGFFTRLAVSEVVFPWAIPNINIRTCYIKIFWLDGGGNPQFFTLTPTSIFTSGGLSGEVMLPVGFYRPAELAARLQIILRYVTSFGGFTVEYGYDVGQFVYKANIPAFTFDAGEGNVFALFRANSDNGYPYPNTTRQLYDLLGLTTNQVNPDGAQTLYSHPTYCQAIKYVDIVCPQLVYNQSLKDAASSTVVQDSLCRLYLANADNSQNMILTATDLSGADTKIFSPPGTVPTTIYRNFTTPKYISWTPNQPISGQLRFQVYDDQGFILDPDLLVNPFSAASTNEPSLPLDWQMTLLVSEN